MCLAQINFVFSWSSYDCTTIAQYNWLILNWVSALNSFYLIQIYTLWLHWVLVSLLSIHYRLVCLQSWGNQYNHFWFGLYAITFLRCIKGLSHVLSMLGSCLNLQKSFLNLIVFRAHRSPGGFGPSAVEELDEAVRDFASSTRPTRR